MPTYLEIAVNVPQVTGAFHYHLPPELEGRVLPGHFVVVPFGKQTVQGVVLCEVDEPAVPETRAVRTLLDAGTVLTPAQMALARHLSASALAPLAACIGLMLPTGLAQQADTLHTLTGQPAPEDLPALQQRLLALLEKRGPLRGRQIDRAVPRIQWRRSAGALATRGLLTRQPVLPPPTIRPKHIRTAQLITAPEKAQAAPLGSTDATRTRRTAILQALIDEPEPMDVAWVYAKSGGKLSDLQILAEKGLIRLSETEIWRDPLANIQYTPSTPPPLTADQQTAWAGIQPRLRAAAAGERVRPILLHGVTGSGKTEIYLRAVTETLALGRQAIILVPEIALTAQTVRRFLARFPGQVGLIHSRLTSGERYDTWRRARTGDLPVIVGPRSALFAPLPNPGLIVVDESHDSSYYQHTPPFYHAREAAVAYAKIAGGVCLMGSATPSVESQYQAKRGVWELVKLPARILAHKETIKAYAEKYGLPRETREKPEETLIYPAFGESQAAAAPPTRYRPLSDDAATTDLPPVRVVDMRQELRAGNRSIFSRALHETLGSTLAQNQQAILFLNRRGTATYVFCRDCGHTLTCPRCTGISLTYHQSLGKLTCHHCGYERNLPPKCPECRSTRIRHYGMGTERVEQEVKAAFPQARVLRWDWETTRKKGAHDLILHHFANHQADVLVGTQMLAKGLDFPLVTLVGIVLADVGLHLPDYRAGERTFQVLSQVSGRAGRSPLGGQVVLQTFDPKHYVMQAAAQHDYAGLYRRELAYRRELGYPPFSQLIRLEYRHPDAAQAEAEARALAAHVRRWLDAEDRRQTELIGPAPCFFTRLDALYRWQIILRGPDPASLLRRRKLADWRVEVNPQSLL